MKFIYKKLFFLLPICFLHFECFAAEIENERYFQKQPDAEQVVSFVKDLKSTEITIQLSKILYKNKAGELGSTTELYLSLYSDAYGPLIADSFVGHTPEIVLLGGTKNPIGVIVKYHAGGAQLIARVYFFDSSRKLFFSKGASIASNLSYIELKELDKSNYLITARNGTRIDDKTGKLKTEEFTINTANRSYELSSSSESIIEVE